MNQEEERISVIIPLTLHSPSNSSQHLRHRRQNRQKTSQHQTARQSTRTRSLRRTRRRATGSRRHCAVATAGGGRRHGGSRSRGRGGISTRPRSRAGALLKLADDKVDDFVAVALDVHVVNGRVAAGVAVDVARVAVRDDAAGVRLADLDAGRAPVEELHGCMLAAELPSL